MQPKSNNLNYIIDPKIRNISRLFVLSFKMVAMILQELLELSITCYY